MLDSVSLVYFSLVGWLSRPPFTAKPNRYRDERESGPAAQSDLR
jgi:hypothetical protein